jgi:hypothetical protein
MKLIHILLITFLGSGIKIYYSFMTQNSLNSIGIFKNSKCETKIHSVLAKKWIQHYANNASDEIVYPIFYEEENRSYSHPSLNLSSVIDYSKLSTDDPLFLNMPWPTSIGPESSAFARHFAWKRGLSDGESKLKNY